MSFSLIQTLKSSLAGSDSRARKAWAEQIVEEGIPLESLLSLLHGHGQTSQRFMWLIGDICERDPKRVADCIETLFELRNQMPFPGMQRSVSKWLDLTNVPTQIEKQAVKQMFAWLTSDEACIASKSYSAKALVQLAKQGRIPRKKLMDALEDQSKHSNRAYGGRMLKLWLKMSALPQEK